jgi:hypothetical protein
MIFKGRQFPAGGLDLVDNRNRTIFEDPVDAPANFQDQAVVFEGMTDGHLRRITRRARPLDYLVGPQAFERSLGALKRQLQVPGLEGEFHQRANGDIYDRFHTSCLSAEMAVDRVVG